MSGVGSTYNLESTYAYKVHFVFNEGEIDEESLDLSEMLVREPPEVFEGWENRFDRPPNAPRALDNGQVTNTMTIALSLFLQSNDPRDMERQVREIRNFFKGAPNRAATLYWVLDGSDHREWIHNCKLKALMPKRNTGDFSIGQRHPSIDLVLESTETEPNYTETGDPAPTAPTRYGPARHRGQTNNNSVVRTVINDVTGLTIYTLTDQGNLYLRGSLIQEDVTL